MNVFAGGIAVFEYIVGLIPEAHALHILAGDVPELFIGRPVFRRRVQRSKEDRIGRPTVGFEVRPETLHAGVNIKASAFIVWFEHLLPKQHFGLILIHFLLVIAQSHTGRGARSYIRNHSLACFAKLRISMLRAFNSPVRCSNTAI